MTSLVIKNPPCNAADVGSIAGGTKIPHASGQLSRPTATTEPTYSRAQHHNVRSCMMQLRSDQWTSEVAQSCPTFCDPMDCSLPGSSSHQILQARILEWIAIPFSRGTFPTQGSNPGLTHRRQILYYLNHEGSPRILEWVVYPFSSISSQQRVFLHCKQILLTT